MYDSALLVAALFSVSRPTVYRSLDRTAELPPFPPAPGPCLMSPGTTSCSPATPDNSDGPGPSAPGPCSRYIPYTPDNGTWLHAAEDQPELYHPGPRRREDVEMTRGMALEDVWI